MDESCHSKEIWKSECYHCPVRGSCIQAMIKSRDNIGRGLKRIYENIISSLDKGESERAIYYISEFNRNKFKRKSFGEIKR